MNWFKGMLGGLAISLLVLASVQYGLPARYSAESVIIFLTAPITFIAGVMASGLKAGTEPTQAQLIFVYFGYWVVAGAFLGWWFGFGKINKIIGLLFVIAVLFGHYQAMQKLTPREVLNTTQTVNAGLFKK